jgi:hypothetical protein
MRCLCERSEILNGDFHLARQLTEWLKDKLKGWKLCYRATDDGWNARDFHRKCDNAESTLTLVECGINIFGGFADQSRKGKCTCVRTLTEHQQ